jgi:hypothetical protein
MSDVVKDVDNGNGLQMETIVTSVKKRGLLGNEYSDEWYTTDQDAEKAIELLQPFGTVMCPFDGESSKFVIKLKDTHSVIYGITDFLQKDYKYDSLVTNPPFSMKNEVLKKVAMSKRPSCLILPLDIVSGVKRRTIYEEYGYPAVFIPSKRMQFINEQKVLSKGSNFVSVFVLYHTKHSGIKWL